MWIKLNWVTLASIKFGEMALVGIGIIGDLNHKCTCVELKLVSFM